MARFLPRNMGRNHDGQYGRGLERQRIPAGAILVGSVGVLGCASVIVTLLMAG